MFYVYFVSALANLKVCFGYNVTGLTILDRDWHIHFFSY